jgi:hypothetical protein
MAKPEKCEEMNMAQAHHEDIAQWLVELLELPEIENDFWEAFEGGAEFLDNRPVLIFELEPDPEDTVVQMCLELWKRETIPPYLSAGALLSELSGDPEAFATVRRELGC